MMTAILERTTRQQRNIPASTSYLRKSGHPTEDLFKQFDVENPSEKDRRHLDPSKLIIEETGAVVLMVGSLVVDGRGEDTEDHLVASKSPEPDQKLAAVFLRQRPLTSDRALVVRPWGKAIASNNLLGKQAVALQEETALEALT